MSHQSFLSPVLGGLLIGLSVAALWVSTAAPLPSESAGSLGASLELDRDELPWRGPSLAGPALGGGALGRRAPGLFAWEAPASLGVLSRGRAARRLRHPARRAGAPAAMGSAA